MVWSSNFFKLDSLESDSDEERNKSKLRVEKSLIKKKSEKENVNSEGEDGVKKSKKKDKKKRSDDSEAVDDDDNGGKKSKKKKKEKKQSGGDEEVLVNTDDVAKRKLDFSDLGGGEDMKDKSNTKKKKKKPSVDLEVGESSLSDGKKKTKEKKLSEDSVLEGNKSNDGNANQIQTESLEDEGNSSKDGKKKRKKKKLSEDSEVEGNKNNDVTENANQIQSESPEAEGNGFKSKKKKKKKQSEDPEVGENNKDSTEDAEKKLSEDSVAEGNDLDSTENAKKERKMKKKKKKQSDDPEAEENNNDGAKTKKRKKKQKGDDSNEDVTTPSSKSAKRVKFSDQVEVFPTEDEETEEEEDDDEEVVEQVSGKRFTKEEDELIRKSVMEYVENHDLGDEGVNMIMDCKAHKELRGCWKEIAAALPWRTHAGVYNRAHTIFEQGSSKGIWTKEDFELLIEYQKKHNNDWRTLADAMGKHRKHVKDAWRRIRLASRKRGQWSREEYQNLFDLVNKDLRMKSFQEKRSKHGMLRDNIPWMVISDQLLTRNHTLCCVKWYNQLLSPMVEKGIWDNVDDYRLLDELTSLDAACVDDVDWDNLLDNRDGDTCRSRWKQMVHHIGLPETKTFAEQVEILSQRYCADIAEDREDFDNRPFDPED